MIVNQINPLLLEITVGQSLSGKRHIIQVFFEVSIQTLATTFTSSHSSEILDFFFKSLCLQWCYNFKSLCLQWCYLSIGIKSKDV